MPALSQKNAPAIVRFFCSLELTIACLVFGMLLIFVGTLAQVHLGIHQVQAEFFHTWIGIWAPGNSALRIPIPGGYLVGGTLLVNLIAAFIYRFEVSTRKAGLLVSHFGIILLLVGELLTGLYQRDGGMWITEGDAKNYAESFRTMELALVDRTDPATDKVLAIHEGELQPGRELGRSEFPLRLRVRAYYGNSEFFNRGPHTGVMGAPLATQGEGLKFTAREIPRTGKQDELDRTVTWVDVLAGDTSLGTWMVGNFFNEPQTFTHDGRSYAIEMRPRRYYQPFSLTLLEFKHDKYPGTEIARNFSSNVRLHDPRTGETRESLIYMNHPLRHDGLTFYQASFRGDDTTMLQVVKNPSRLLPYIACSLVFLGLGFHFIYSLTHFLERRKAAAA